MVPASAVRQLASANSRRISKMLPIELTKGHSGLGFSFTTSYNSAGGNSPIYIKDVLQKGAAIEDGRLRPGDRILEVNGTPMTGKNQTDAVAILCNIPLGKTVQLVVSREETETVEEESELIRYPLANFHSARQGVILMGKSTSPANGSVDLGIFIKSIIPGSTAYKDGLLQTNDQLVNINGISLLGMSNRNAMEIVRNNIAQYILEANENGNDPNAQRPEVPHRNNNNTYGYGRKDKLLMPSLEEKKSNYPPTLSSIQGESMMIKGGYNHNVKKTADSHPVTGNAVENLNVVPSGSQLSLDESNPGFVRDGFGQQSMSEKSMHAQLDARSTGTYQHSKKARKEKDKHWQSSKLDYTQEGGTEFNPKIISVTGGAKSFLGYPKDPVNVASCTMTEILLPTKRLERQKCATCDFQSFDRKGFKEHLVIHKKKKTTYQCQECGLCFVTETTLCKHLLIIHKIRDTKKYLEDEGSNFMPDIEETEVYCHVCFQTFTKGIALKGHLRSHGMDYIRSIRSNAPR